VSLFRPHPVSSLHERLALIQWASIGLRALRALLRKPGARRAVLAPANAYWFLPIFGWGVDCVRRVIYCHTVEMEFAPTLRWALLETVVAVVVLLMLLASSVVAERAARRVGAAVRRSAGSVPLPAVGAIISAGLV
jgi:hypothetical protein